MKQYLLCLLCVCVSVCMLAQPSASYYSSRALDGKNGQALELALSAIIYPHTVRDYSDLWSDFETTDPGPSDSIPAGSAYSDLVYDMYAWMQERPHFYSENDRTQTTGINREHSVPNSWWGGASGNAQAYTDLHHMVPADGAVNQRKSNYPLGCGHNLVNARANSYPNSGSIVWSFASTGADDVGGGGGHLWEPVDEYKGDFARMYLYIVCAYEGRIHWETEYMFTSDANNHTTIKPWAKELLLQWHRQDPISDKERARNNAVYRIQHNRNPFIDYPELVEFIWGNRSSEAFSLSAAISAYSNAYQPDDSDNQHTDVDLTRQTPLLYTHVAYLGQPFAAPELTTNSPLPVTYTSSNPSVATVDPTTGSIVLRAAGTTLIIATQPENEDFTAGRAEYLLEVR